MRLKNLLIILLPALITSCVQSKSSVSKSELKSLSTYQTSGSNSGSKNSVDNNVKIVEEFGSALWDCKATTVEALAECEDEELNRQISIIVN